MPTLIRLVVILLVLVGLAYGAMFALVMMVTPNEKEVTIRIPARDLMPSPQRDPLVLRDIDTSRTADSPPPDSAPATEAPAQTPAEGATDENGVVTLAPGTE
jgi:hypothetical protein